MSLSVKEKENIKHILRQSLYAMHLLDAAIEKRESMFEGKTDELSKFFHDKGSLFTTHMAAISALYNFIVIPKELIVNELGKNSKEYIYINDELKRISHIIEKENKNGDADLFRRLRNSLAHGNIILNEGGFIFHDKNTNGHNKISFEIKATDLIPLISYIEYNILIPFIGYEKD